VLASATGAEGVSALADIRGISHVALDVADLAASIDFYRRMLGLRVVVDDTGNPVQPNIKGMVGDFLIELSQLPAARQGADVVLGRTGLPGPTVSLTVRDADTAFANLRAEGLVTVDAPACTGGVRYFTIRDPDGHAIELIEIPGGFASLGALVAAHADAR
jgi:catechol 2,3-dioxygenase-like lactoylglutathione lyase family enzyme